jgi:TolB-like protein/Flp pilus assembly protein TadD
VSVVLFVALIAWAGFYFYNRKTDSTEKSIAILPFDNLSSNDNTQFFADGIVEDLLTRLSSIKNLKVISRTSSEMFRDKGKHTIPEIAEILDVGYILEGTVQQESDNIRISVQLIDAENDDHVLSKQYDRNLNELFEVQREIAAEIAADLSPVLSDQQLEKLKHNHTQNIKALQLYQIGRFHSSKRTTEEFEKGIEYYEQALEEDPNYALAYAGLADNYHLMAIQGRIDKTEGDSLALAMAEKALKIDPDLAEAHTVMGSIYIFVDWNWNAAEKEFLKAIQLNPNYSTAHQYYSEYLTTIGRDEEARAHIDQALELDPLSFVIRYLSSIMYYNQEQFHEALSEIKVCLDLNSMHEWATSLIFGIGLALKNDSLVISALKNTAQLTDLWTPEEADSVYQIGGIDGIKRWVTGVITFEPEYTKAIFYAMLGEYDNALDMLELAAEAGHVSLLSTTWLEYKPLRSNPRFIAIREKMGLPPLNP